MKEEEKHFMYIDSSRNFKFNLDVQSLCKYINSRLDDLKSYLVSFFKKENKDILNQYLYYYNSLFDLLNIVDIFKKEHRALFKINKIIEYTLKNEPLTNEIKEFISQVLQSFTRLLEFKLYMIKNDQISLQKEYDEKYSIFRDELRKHNQYFYKNIHKYDDTYEYKMNEISEIIL